MDGTLDVWDLFYKHNEPTLMVQVSDQALTCFAAHEGGANVAIGTSDGAVTVLHMSAGLSEMAPNEKSAINNMLDRETQREKVSVAHGNRACCAAASDVYCTDI